MNQKAKLGLQNKNVSFFFFRQKWQVVLYSGASYIQASAVDDWHEANSLCQQSALCTVRSEAILVCESTDPSSFSSGFYSWSLPSDFALKLYWV